MLNGDIASIAPHLHDRLRQLLFFFIARHYRNALSVPSIVQDREGAHKFLRNATMNAARVEMTLITNNAI